MYSTELVIYWDLPSSVLGLRGPPYCLRKTERVRMRTVSFRSVSLLGKEAFRGITETLIKCHADLGPVIISRVSENDLHSACIVNCNLN